MAEYFWEWNRNNIHIDHYTNENAPSKIIMQHSLGGTGRLLPLINVPLLRAGFEILCPDLHPFGLSINHGDKTIYKDWALMINDLIIHERSVDDKPIFLFGQRTSGMLVYDVSTMNESVSGIIVKSLIDQGKMNLRMRETLNSQVSAIDLPELNNTNRFGPAFGRKAIEDIGINKYISMRPPKFSNKKVLWDEDSTIEDNISNNLHKN